MDYVGRFAPSPTGPLHYGSLVAAVASFLDARHAGGKWLLRIEDLDPPRESTDAPQEIVRQLLALGLHWDLEVLCQSSRLSSYDAALEAIQPFTFPCTCSRKAVPDVYPGTCRLRKQLTANGPYAVRLRVPRRSVSINDRCLGLQTWDLEKEVGDFVIKRKDGLHAYQLAVVVDDIHCSVSHIVRGNDLLDSTPRQLALYEHLQVPPPEYLHIPVLVDESGNKLSKQAHAKPVDTSDALTTIRSALSDLGQNTHDYSLNIKELLEKAASSWNPASIPNVHDICAPNAYLSS
ncbi:MAG: tRNA glutamyl-Q(34) synthetase GluQRS [Gammaproteobacteria bacterium]|jgi:glutamyl-Q tRNA(Asp) synthetase|nr:tRNA glutamyl-Q(34) synthetase GluQRS [Gammaproteobacteria bacterium]